MAVTMIAICTVNGVRYGLRPTHPIGVLPAYLLVAGTEVARVSPAEAPAWLAARGMPDPETFIRECLEAFDRHPNP